MKRYQTSLLTTLKNRLNSSFSKLNNFVNFPGGYQNESIGDVKELMPVRCLIPVKKTLMFILVAGCFITVKAQEKTNSYRWQQYGIEILTEESLQIVEADQDKFRCDGDECNLWINHLPSSVSNVQMENSLLEGIEAKGLGKAGQIKKEIRDSLSVFSVRVENNKSYGYVFILKDTLRGNHCFFGYMSTGSKPRANMLKLLEFRLFAGDPSCKPLVSRSAQSMMNVTDANHELIKAYTGSDTLLIGKDKIRETIMGLCQTYSGEITGMMNLYQSLPETLGARKIATHEDFIRYFSDTLDFKWLFTNSTFAHEMYHNVVRWMSMVQSIKKTRGNYSDKYYTYFITDTCTINVEKLEVPPANIIHKSFPGYDRGNIYSLYIYPSNMSNSTQVEGIYALLNEFGANLEELVWYNDILQYYFDKKMNNVHQLGNYLANSTKGFSDCIQFYHYILHYMQTLRCSTPELYTNLTGNVNFKRIINLMEQKLNNQVALYNSNKRRINEMLANEYIGFLENDSKLTLDNDNSWDNTDLTRLNRQIDYINTQTDYQRISADLGTQPCIQIDIIKE